MFLLSILFSEAVFNLSFYRNINCKQYFINYGFIEKAIVRKKDEFHKSLHKKQISAVTSTYWRVLDENPACDNLLSQAKPLLAVL